MTRIVDADGVLEGEAFTEERLVRLLAGALKLKYLKRDSAEQYKATLKPFEDWLLDNPGQRVRDGELGIVARWVDGGEEDVLDTATMAETEPEAFIALGRARLLKLDATAFKTLKDKLRAGAVAERFIFSKPRTGHVSIDKEDR